MPLWVLLYGRGEGQPGLFMLLSLGGLTVLCTVFVHIIQKIKSKPKFFCTFPIFYFEIFLVFLFKYIYQMVFMLSIYKRKMKKPNFSAKKIENHTPFPKEMLIFIFLRFSFFQVLRQVHIPCSVEQNPRRRLIHNYQTIGTPP